MKSLVIASSVIPLTFKSRFCSLKILLNKNLPGLLDLLRKKNMKLLATWFYVMALLGLKILLESRLSTEVYLISQSHDFLKKTSHIF